MSDSDLPVTGTVEDTSLSNRQGDEAIGNLLDNLGPDLVEDEEQAQAPAAQAAPSPDEGESDDDGLVIDDEGESQSEDAPEEQEFNGGRFASDDAKVKLEDGTTISVAELKRNNLFQKDYSKKTEELATHRKMFEQETRQVKEHVDRIVQQREVILTLADELLPQEPVMPTDPNDPVAFLDYQREKVLWDQKQGKLRSLVEAKKQQEIEKTEAVKAEELKILHDLMPIMKTDAGKKAWLAEAAPIAMEAWGLTPEILGAIPSGIQIKILDEAIRYRKALAKQKAGKQPPPQAQQQQPRIIQKQRMASTPQQRDANTALERLRNTGSARDAEAALMKFIN